MDTRRSTDSSHSRDIPRNTGSPSSIPEADADAPEEMRSAVPVAAMPTSSVPSAARHALRRRRALRRRSGPRQRAERVLFHFQGRVRVPQLNANKMRFMITSSMMLF